MGEIRLPWDLYDRLDALARRHGVSLEYVIRVALEYFLAQQERLEARNQDRVQENWRRYQDLLERIGPWP